MNKIALLVLLFLLTACEQQTPVIDKLSENAVILAFGDSLTYGAGASKDADYPSVLSSLSHHEVINEGIPGETSDQGLQRLPDLLDEYQPELLVLIHGGNDILRKLPSQQTRQNLVQMINEAEQRDIKVVMLGVPEPNLFLLSSADIYQQIAEQKNIPIDLEALPEILKNRQLKSDTIHPNNEGYKLMAEKIYNLLRNSGAL